MAATTELRLQVSRAFAPLFVPARYKGACGGRGGGKSHQFAGMIVVRCLADETRAACIREYQTTIKDSVRQLIIDKIVELRAEDEFEILENEIRCKRTKSIVIFRGMQSFNAENIKSLEGFDIAWVEEAQTFSERSLRMLRPTIRKEGSEIWFSWNPRHETDAVDAFFRSGRLRQNAILVQVNWDSNPWFPEVLKAEMREDYARDPDMAQHVWGGGYEVISESAYYARDIAKAERQGRVGAFPYDPTRPVITSWDIGVDDYTAIWFWQEHGLFFNVIDYYEASGIGAEEIIREALPELLPDVDLAVQRLSALRRPKPFLYGRHHFPHDVKVREWGAGAKERVHTLIELGIKASDLKVGAATKPEDRIAAARKLLPRVRFNKSERVSLGLSRLRRYSRRRNEAMGTYLGPLHDENSHGADAFGEFAVNSPLARDAADAPPPAVQPPGTVVLLGPDEPQREQRRSIFHGT